MFLQIDDHMTVEDVQDRFNKCFPLLKIAFYSKAHKKFRASDKTYVYDPKTQIGAIRKNHFNGTLEMKSWYTTARVEEELKKKFGLNAQIFRWDGVNDWTQTSLSDELTLEQQGQLPLDAGLTNNDDST